MGKVSKFIGGALAVSTLGLGAWGAGDAELYADEAEKGSEAQAAPADQGENDAAVREAKLIQEARKVLLERGEEFCRAFGCKESERKWDMARLMNEFDFWVKTLPETVAPTACQL